MSDDDNVIPFPEKLETFRMKDIYPPGMSAKWAMVRVIEIRLENAGIPRDRLIAQMSTELSQPPEIVDKWLNGLVREVSLDTLALMFDACADLTTRTYLEAVISDANI